MFDFDVGKLLIIAIVALVVIGPKDLPRVMRQVGQMVAKLRRMAGDFQSQFMDAMREAELDDIRKDVASAAESAKLGLDFNPIADVKRELSAAMTDRPAMPAGAPELDLDVPKFGEDDAANAEAVQSGMADASAAGAAPVAGSATGALLTPGESASGLADEEVAAPVPTTPVMAEAIAPIAPSAPSPEPVPVSRTAGSA